jgi:phage shock protein PspC (stress-responsive transcriptional regulator)
MTNKLYRSRTDRMLGGVCGGLAAYLGIDSTLVRLFFVLLALGPGIGVLVYIVMWILVPEQGVESTWRPTFGSASSEGGEAQQTGEGGNELAVGDRARAMGEDLRQALTNPNPKAGMIIGGALVILGVLYLVQNLNIPALNWIKFDLMWPFLLILAGIALLVRQLRGT